MNIQAEKLEIMKMILDTENPGIIKAIKKLFNKERETDFWETLTESQKQEITAGIKDADNGDVLDFEIFMGKHRP